MNNINVKKDVLTTIRQAAGILVIAIVGFIVFEPAISLAIETQFTVTQVVTAEISFLISASNVIMSPPLPGITGGTSNGSTQVAVLTNNAAGYTMSITASSSAGMLGNTQGGTIPAYIPAATGVPDFTFTAPINRARFGYTVEASTTADLDPSFKDNGAVCNTGALDTVNACWLNSSTTPETIINRTTATSASGATTTIKFRVVINSNPSPAIPQDTYVSTTTLTAVTN